MKLKKWVTTLGAIAGISLLIVGCGKEEAQPVEIAEGVDKCDVCHMHVPNDHNATEIILKNGKALKFDDIGCLHEWTEQHGTDEVAMQYVRDYYTAEWTKAEQATFAYDKEFKTPMSYGIYSFKDKAEAEKFVAEQKKGVIMDAEGLKNHTWERSMSESMKKGGHASEGHSSGEQPSGNSENAPAHGSSTPTQSHHE